MMSIIWSGISLNVQLFALSVAAFRDKVCPLAVSGSGDLTSVQRMYGSPRCHELGMLCSCALTAAAASASSAEVHVLMAPLLLLRLRRAMSTSINVTKGHRRTENLCGSRSPTRKLTNWMDGAKSAMEPHPR